MTAEPAGDRGADGNQGQIHQAQSQQPEPGHRAVGPSAVVHVAVDGHGNQIVHGIQSSQKGLAQKNSPPLLSNKNAAPGESPSLDLEFTLAGPCAGPEGRVCLARGSAVWEARIL